MQRARREWTLQFSQDDLCMYHLHTHVRTHTDTTTQLHLNTAIICGEWLWPTIILNHLSWQRPVRWWHNPPCFYRNHIQIHHRHITSISRIHVCIGIGVVKCLFADDYIMVWHHHAECSFTSIFCGHPPGSIWQPHNFGQGSIHLAQACLQWVEGKTKGLKHSCFSAWHHECGGLVGMAFGIMIGRDFYIKNILLCVPLTADYMYVACACLSRSLGSNPRKDLGCRCRWHSAHRRTPIQTWVKARINFSEIRWRGHSTSAFAS